MESLYRDIKNLYIIQHTKTIEYDAILLCTDVKFEIRETFIL
jgi:hypothetical protein